MYFEWPESVAMRPSSDWPSCPTIIDAPSEACRSGPNRVSHGSGKGGSGADSLGNVGPCLLPVDD